jgi:kynurenine 3-monooxygenase
VLDECLEECRGNREHAFAQYFRRRKENADALADLAIGNFIEMRDKTASKIFRAKKKLDHALEAALPGIYLPLYAMVTFTRIPYSAAAKRARLQDQILYACAISVLVIGIVTVAFLLGRS